MSNALTALDKGKPRAEPLMVAIAAVSIGMFAGTWIIGPSVSVGLVFQGARDGEAPMTYEQMIARPDPFPYRTATPAFDRRLRPAPRPSSGSAQRPNTAGAWPRPTIRGRASAAGGRARPACRTGTPFTRTAPHIDGTMGGDAFRWIVSSNSAPISTAIVDSHIHIIRPMAAPSEP